MKTGNPDASMRSKRKGSKKKPTQADRDCS